MQTFVAVDLPRERGPERGNLRGIEGLVERTTRGTCALCELDVAGRHRAQRLEDAAGRTALSVRMAHAYLRRELGQSMPQSGRVLRL